MTTTQEILKAVKAPARACRECGQEFTPAIATVLEQYITVCPECCEKQALLEQARVVADSKSVREYRWHAICPDDFRDTEPFKLPRPHLLQKLLGWKFGPKGLILHGPTGTGKSRCAWVLLEREWRSGKIVVGLNSGTGIRFASKYDAGTREVERWIDLLSEVDILFLDDVFKSKLTEAFEAALFTVISTRTEKKLPIICALNDTGETLMARMSPDRGDALIRRLKEFCEPVAFTKATL